MSPVTSALITDIRSVLLDSDYHKDWTEYDYSQLVYPAVENNHAFLVFDENMKPSCFFTWAFLDKEAEQRYCSRKGIRAEYFVGEEGNPWVIDFAAPYGNCRKMVRVLRDNLKARYGPRFAGKIFRPRKNHFGQMYTAWDK